jgi:murein DD-endopeptidase MepM/ murein hydrolase activator NlpD
LLLSVTAACRSSRSRPATEAATERPEAQQPATPDGAASLGGIRHPLQKGQTLYSLSRAYGVPVATLMEANAITDPSTIPAGTPILIPGARELRAIPPASGPRLAWPLDGPITSRYGPRGSRLVHEGLDIQGRRGQRITAAADGKVIFAGRAGNYGRTVVIDHGGSIYTRYAHASELLVRTGDRVKRGEAIAIVGDTGNATGIHLHFEVLRQGRRLDPESFLPG